MGTWGPRWQWAYGGLLAILLVAFAIHPFAARFPAGAVLFRFLYPVLLISSLVAVSGSRRVVIVGLLVLVPSLGMTTIAQGSGAFWVWGNLLGSVFLVIVIATILRDVLTHQEISAHSVAGALSVFLLMGIAWTLLYEAIDGAVLNAFSGLHDDPATRESQLFYFSFVTLTTLGYGDVTPLAPESRSLAALEAIVGQFYLVVLVAALVGRFVSGRHSAHPS